MPVTRRFFLQSTGALAAYLGVVPFDMLSAADPKAANGPQGKILVVIFLRGGVDGLNLVVPHADPYYSKLRSSIAIPAPGQEGGAIDLDGNFGLHPRLDALVPYFRSGQAVAAHAVGYDRNTRSHFEEQDVWETGVIGNTIYSDGWLNRHLATTVGTGPVRAVSVGNSLPRILRGKASAYALRGLSDLTLPKLRGDADVVAAALQQAYQEHLQSGMAQQLLAETGQATLEGIRMMRGVADAEYRPQVEYPNTELARRLREVARLIKADVGLEVAEVDYGGWDTHQNQGNGAGGAFGKLAQTLGDAMAAFCGDLKERLDKVLVVTLSDFGRTAAENGTRGTDHGWANCMLAVGGAVARAGGGEPRPVVTRWPGLGPEQLHQGRDLLHTTDFRDVLAELVQVQLGNPHLEKVLPEYSARPLGLIA
ncbi:MAG: DUF1501 domain-containing protein [Planctomycetota bacterium]